MSELSDMPVSDLPVELNAAFGRLQDAIAKRIAEAEEKASEASVAAAPSSDNQGEIDDLNRQLAEARTEIAALKANLAKAIDDKLAAGQAVDEAMARLDKMIGATGTEGS